MYIKSRSEKKKKSITNWDSRIRAVDSMSYFKTQDIKTLDRCSQED